MTHFRGTEFLREVFLQLLRLKIPNNRRVFVGNTSKFSGHAGHDLNWTKCLAFFGGDSSSFDSVFYRSYLWGVFHCPRSFQPGYDIVHLYEQSCRHIAKQLLGIALHMNLLHPWAAQRLGDSDFWYRSSEPSPWDSHCLYLKFSSPGCWIKICHQILQIYRQNHKEHPKSKGFWLSVSLEFWLPRSSTCLNPSSNPAKPVPTSRSFSVGSGGSTPRNKTSKNSSCGKHPWAKTCFLMTERGFKTHGLNNMENNSVSHHFTLLQCSTFSPLLVLHVPVLFLFQLGTAGFAVLKLAQRRQSSAVGLNSFNWEKMP